MRAARADLPVPVAHKEEPRRVALSELRVDGLGHLTAAGELNHARGKVLRRAIPED